MQATEDGDSLEALGRTLGEKIADSPEYEAFQAAQAKVEADDEAQEQISEFNQLREEFMVARQMGEATQEDVQTVQRAQKRLHSLPVMQEYLDAQAALQARLAEVNDAISEPLDVDFGGEAGGCCHD